MVRFIPDNHMSPLNLVFDSLTTAVLVFGPNNICLYANESCQALLLKSHRALSGKTVGEILNANGEVVAQCQLASQHKQRMVLREVEIYLPDWKRQLFVDLTITPCGLDEGEGLLLELIDRKEVRKLSHDTDMLARFKVATQIVRGLAHEIKNPLGGIRGAAQLLALETDSTETQEYTSVITQEVDRLSDLLTRMSGENNSFERARIDIHEPVTHVADLLKAEHGDILELSYNFDTSLPPLDVNPDQLKQALLNLMKNAVQWSLIACQSSDSDADKHRSANVSIRTRAAYPNLMRSLMPQQGIRIQIQDNGLGVDQSIIDQLFLPMVTRREGGAGLGLSISQEIAQSHGGFIELDEQQDTGGASFSLYLPYCQLETDKGED